MILWGIIFSILLYVAVKTKKGETKNVYLLLLFAFVLASIVLGLANYIEFGAAESPFVD